MNEGTFSQNPPDDGRLETMSALFAHMVLQQTNMALMLLGKVPHPQTGERVQDLEAAQMFIDQLEMLEVKTKGNLDKREEGLLKQSLAAVRMAFVEAVEHRSGAPPPQREPTGTAAAAASATPTTGADGKEQQPGAGSATTSAEEPRKKFTKKY
jgi:hypothetical protein